MGTKSNKTSRPNINEEIRAKEVRVIGSNGEQLGIFSIKDALNIAYEQGLDLIEVSPNAEPPVCKIGDFGKFIFEKEKKEKEAKKHQKKIELREIRFTPGIGEHDYDFKLKKAKEFLAEGSHVLFRLRYRGREILHADKGYEVFERIKNDLAEIGIVEKPPKIEGKNLTMVIVPAKKK
ncbi:MAG: translation initiation factor IF-3 [Spirochaetes bacterium]|nr:translation initiation factor IF-3 [Spirochaetota bacterium]